MTDDDRASLADLAMRALDTILEDYGDDAQLMAATVVFEVRTPGADEADDLFYTNYQSLAGNSPHHIAGLLYGTALHILAPASDVDTDG